MTVGCLVYYTAFLVIASIGVLPYRRDCLDGSHQLVIGCEWHIPCLGVRCLLYYTAFSADPSIGVYPYLLSAGIIGRIRFDYIGLTLDNSLI